MFWTQNKWRCWRVTLDWSRGWRGTQWASTLRHRSVNSCCWSWTWRPPGICGCTLTNAFHKVLGLHSLWLCGFLFSALIFFKYDAQATSGHHLRIYLHFGRSKHVRCLKKKEEAYLRSCLMVQVLCESRGGRTGLSVLTNLLVSVDVKSYWTRLRHWSQPVPNLTSEDIKHQFIII